MKLRIEEYGRAAIFFLIASIIEYCGAADGTWSRRADIDSPAQGDWIPLPGSSLIPQQSHPQPFNQQPRLLQSVGPQFLNQQFQQQLISPWNGDGHENRPPQQFSEENLNKGRDSIYLDIRQPKNDQEYQQKPNHQEKEQVQILYVPVETLKQRSRGLSSGQKEQIKSKTNADYPQEHGRSHHNLQQQQQQLQQQQQQQQQQQPHRQQIPNPYEQEQIIQKNIQQQRLPHRIPPQQQTLNQQILPPPQFLAPQPLPPIISPQNIQQYQQQPQHQQQNPIQTLQLPQNLYQQSDLQQHPQIFQQKPQQIYLEQTTVPPNQKPKVKEPFRHPIQPLKEQKPANVKVTKVNDEYYSIKESGDSGEKVDQIYAQDGETLASKPKYYEDLPSREESPRNKQFYRGEAIERTTEVVNKNNNEEDWYDNIPKSRTEQLNRQTYDKEENRYSNQRESIAENQYNQRESVAEKQYNQRESVAEKQYENNSKQQQNYDNDNLDVSPVYRNTPSPTRSYQQINTKDRNELSERSRQTPSNKAHNDNPSVPPPNQPPLSVYMETSADTKVGDVLGLLKGAKTIPVLDTIGPNSPQVFVGPSNLKAPEGYVKFELPYLSSLDGNRVERRVLQLPFFVAPLNFQPPPGYAKIPFPPPHIGSVVLSNISNSNLLKNKYETKNTLSTQSSLITTQTTREPYTIPADISSISPHLPSLINSLQEEQNIGEQEVVTVKQDIIAETELPPRKQITRRPSSVYRGSQRGYLPTTSTSIPRRQSYNQRRRPYNRRQQTTTTTTTTTEIPTTIINQQEEQQYSQNQQEEQQYSQNQQINKFSNLNNYNIYDENNKNIQKSKNYDEIPLQQYDYLTTISTTAATTTTTSTTTEEIPTKQYYKQQTIPTYIPSYNDFIDTKTTTENYQNYRIQEQQNYQQQHQQNYQQQAQQNYHQQIPQQQQQQQTFQHQLQQQIPQHQQNVLQQQQEPEQISQQQQQSRKPYQYYNDQKFISKTTENIYKNYENDQITTDISPVYIKDITNKPEKFNYQIVPEVSQPELYKHYQNNDENHGKFLYNNHKNENENIQESISDYTTQLPIIETTKLPTTTTTTTTLATTIKSRNRFRGRLYNSRNRPSSTTTVSYDEKFYDHTRRNYKDETTETPRRTNNLRSRRPHRPLIASTTTVPKTISSTDATTTNTATTKYLIRTRRPTNAQTKLKVGRSRIRRPTIQTTTPTTTSITTTTELNPFANYNVQIKQEPQYYQSLPEVTPSPIRYEFTENPQIYHQESKRPNTNFRIDENFDENDRKSITVAPLLSENIYYDLQNRNKEKLGNKEWLKNNNDELEDIKSNEDYQQTKRIKDYVNKNDVWLKPISVKSEISETTVKYDDKFYDEGRKEIGKSKDESYWDENSSRKNSNYDSGSRTRTPTPQHSRNHANHRRHRVKPHKEIQQATPLIQQQSEDNSKQDFDEYYENKARVTLPKHSSEASIIEKPTEVSINSKEAENFWNQAVTIQQSKSFVYNPDEDDGSELRKSLTTPGSLSDDYFYDDQSPYPSNERKVTYIGVKQGIIRGKDDQYRGNEEIILNNSDVGKTEKEFLENQKTEGAAVSSNITGHGPSDKKIGRKRGTWVKIRVRKTNDVFETAESQRFGSLIKNSNSLINNDKEIEKNNLIIKNDNNKIETTTIDLPITTIFTRTTENNLKDIETTTDLSNIKLDETTIFNQYETTTIIPAETTTIEQQETVTPKVLGTSTTTEITLETEICYRGRCVKTKPSPPK